MSGYEIFNIEHDWDSGRKIWIARHTFPGAAEELRICFSEDVNDTAGLSGDKLKEFFESLMEFDTFKEMYQLNQEQQ